MSFKSHSEEKTGNGVFLCYRIYVLSGESLKPYYSNLFRCSFIKIE